MKTVRCSDFVAAWSLRREREFEFCPRRYFLRYYAARGGHDELDADRRTRELYDRSKLIGRGAYLQRLVNEAMRELFYAPEEGPAPPTLALAALRRLREELGMMLAGDNGIARRLPMLIDLTDPALRPERLRRELEKTLRERCDALVRGDWPRVMAVPPPYRRSFSAPLEVYASEVLCHTPAVLEWQKNGVLYVLEGVSQVPEGEAAELTSLLHRLHALTVPGADAGKVRSLCFDESGKLVEFGSDLEPGRALRHLRDGFAKLCPHSGEIWSEEDFPPKMEKCPDCVFSDVCGAENSASRY